MRGRPLLLIVAAILGLLATLGVGAYVSRVQAQVADGQETVEVLVAKTAVPAGVGAQDLLRKDLVEAQRIPKLYLVEGAIGSLDELSDEVTVAPLAPGDQLSRSKFQKPASAGLRYSIPDDMVAVSIPIDDIVGVGGYIQQGDRVAVIATFKPGPGGLDTTRILLPNVSVLGIKAASQPGRAGAGSGGANATLAVTPADAEKLVFAEEKGHVWLSLLHAKGTTKVRPAGQTVETIFK